MTNPGRPPFYGTPMRRVQVMLDKETLQRIEELPGNRSEVIRKAVEFAWRVKQAERTPG